MVGRASFYGFSATGFDERRDPPERTPAAPFPDV
jgi:hypothetical protein